MSNLEHQGDADSGGGAPFLTPGVVDNKKMLIDKTFWWRNVLL